MVTAASYRCMEVMGCPPLSVPTLDPRSYRMGPRQGKKRLGTPAASRVIDGTVAGAGAVGAEVYDAGRFKEAREVFEQVALAEDLIVFLTLPAYRLMD